MLWDPEVVEVDARNHSYQMSAAGCALGVAICVPSFPGSDSRVLQTGRLKSSVDRSLYLDKSPFPPDFLPSDYKGITRQMGCR